MAIEQYTYWSVTINNPDDNDYLIVKNPNAKYIREVVWTPEVGEEGTRHIQGWIRLQRNQSQAFVKKLYPRAHIKPCRKDDYNENCHQYAQKDDNTTAGAHHITLNDPMPAADTALYQVLQTSFDEIIQLDKKLKDVNEHEGPYVVLQSLTLKHLRTDFQEKKMVSEKAGLEKIFCSPTYERMKQKFWREILYRYIHTNTDAQHSNASTTQVEDREGDSDSYEESEASSVEGSDQSSSCETDEEDDF